MKGLTVDSKVDIIVLPLFQNELDLKGSFMRLDESLYSGSVEDPTYEWRKQKVKKKDGEGSGQITIAPSTGIRMESLLLFDDAREIIDETLCRKAAASSG
jgi:hypothetical protein